MAFFGFWFFRTQVVEFNIALSTGLTLVRALRF